MTRNRLIVVIVLVLAVAGAALFLTGRGGPTSGAASPAPSIPAVAESTTVTSDARAVPIHHVELSAPGAGGVVAEVMVAEGDTVRAGQPLLRLDDAQANAEVEEAQAAADGRGSHGRAKAAVDQARRPGRRRPGGRRQARAGGTVADANRDGTPSGHGRRRPTPRWTGRGPRSGRPGAPRLPHTRATSRAAPGWRAAPRSSGDAR